MADVFVSYAREDIDAVRRLHDALVARGMEVWVDWEGIEPSDRWLDSIREAIDGADAVVAIVSPAFLASEICALECEHASSLNKRLIPIVVAEPGEGQPVPPSIAEINWIFLRSSDDFERGIEALARAVDTDIDLIRTHTRVLTRARAWELAGRKPSPLLRGEELRLAESWLARAAAGSQPQPTELQAEFVAASRRQTTRRQRLTVVLSLAVAVLAVGLSVFAVLQRNEARDQRQEAQKQRDEARRQADISLSRSLAAESRAANAADQAVLLSLEARAVRDTPQARSATVSVSQRLRGVAAAFSGGGAAIADIDVSGDGQTLAVAAEDGLLELWDVRQRAPVTEPVNLGDPPIVGVALAGDATSGVVATNTLVRTFTVEGGIQADEPFGSEQGFLYDFAVSADGLRAASVGSLSGLQVFDPTSGELLFSRPASGAALLSVTFSPDGAAVFTGDNTGAVTGWDATTGVPVAGTPTPQSGVGIFSLAFAPDASLLAAGGSDGGIRLVSYPAFQSLGDPVSMHRSGIRDLAFSPDGQTLATAGDDGQVGLWRVYEGSTDTLSGHRGAVNAVEFAPDGGILYSGGADGTVLAWAVPRAPLVRSLVPDGFVEDVAFSPDGSTIAVPVYPADGGGRVVRYGVSDLAAVGEPLVTASGSPPHVASAKDGTLVIWTDGSVELAKPGAEAPAPVAVELVSEIRSGAVSPDGETFAAGLVDGSIRLVDLTGKDPAGRTLAGHAKPVQSVAFDAAGTRLVSGDEEGTLILWDASTGEQLATEPSAHSGAVYEVAFGHDGSTLASGGTDTLIRLWSLGANRSELLPSQVLRGHRDDVTGLAFAPAGDLLASTALDGSVRMWDVGSGLPVGDPALQLTAARGVAFSPDGGTLAVRTLTDVQLEDVEPWTGDSGELKAALCTVAGRNLTPAEFREFLPGRPYHRTCDMWPAGGSDQGS
ncbi:MAG: TIR domain-containing protein [Gaiellales bacterium]